MSRQQLSSAGGGRRRGAAVWSSGRLHRNGPLHPGLAVRACVLAASPDYLNKAGLRRTPDDLSAHAIIIGPVSTTANWPFRKSGATTSIRVDGYVQIAGNKGGIAAVAGVGIVMTSSGSLRRKFGEGSLVGVLDD